MLAGAVFQVGVASAANAPLIGPPPAWVHGPPAPPAADKTLEGLPLTLLLSDEQFGFDAEGWTEYYERQIKVQAPIGLQALSAIPFQWSPWSDTLTFHRVRILRDGQSIDVLPKDGVFTVLRRETGLEQAMLTGELTALLQPEGLQVGDVLEISASIRHADPLLRGKTGALVANWDKAPTRAMRLEAHWPSSLAVRWRETTGLPPLRQTTAEGVTTVTLELKDVRPQVLPAHAPERFQHGRQIEFSTLTGWKQVADVMAPLYAKAAELAPDSGVAAQAKQIAQSTRDPKARAAAALKLVQGQVRYLAHTEAAGGYTPQGADETWRLRYGDCKAKTVLLLALLQALGVPAEPVLANTTGGDGLDAHLPSASLFNHVLVRVKLDGRDYWLDGAREGDRSLDDLSPPAYGWVLPLYAPKGRLVHLVPAQPAQPQMLQIIRYDASAGVTGPEPTRLETTFRGDAATQLHAQLSLVAPERMDAALKAYWASVHTAFTAAHVAAAWNPATGEETLKADGTSKLDWSGTGLELQHVRLGGEPDIKRDDAASDLDAPYVVGFPSYVETDESVVLPPGDTLTPQIIKTADVDTTIAGVAYHRAATISGNVFRVVASQRALQPEISAAEARASVDPLTKLGEIAVYAPAGPLAKAANDAAALDSSPTTVDDHIRRGNALLDAGRYKEAVSDFDSAIGLDPKSQWAWAGRAVAHAWLDDTAATADADKADTLGPPANGAAHARGILATMKGDHDGARAAYDRALILSPGDAFALGKLIELDLAVPDLPAARKHLDALLQAHTEMAGEVHFYRASIEEVDHHKAAAEQELSLVPVGVPGNLILRAHHYLELGDKDLARADVDAANRLQPTAANWLLRASIDGGYASAAAKADVDAALKLAPDDLDTQIWLVNAATYRHDYKSALFLIDHLVNTDPEGAGNLLVGRAEIEGKLGQQGQMDADFVRAEAMTGASAPQALVLCNGELKAKWRPDHALATCEKAIHEAPYASGPRLNKAVLLHRLGREAEAVKTLDGVEAKAGGASGLNNICYNLAVEGMMLDRALADCDASLKLRPDNAATLDSRGFVLMRLGRNADALAAYNAALAADPKEYNSLYGRALVEERLGRAAESARDTAAALAGRPGVRAAFKEMGLS